MHTSIPAGEGEDDIDKIVKSIMPYFTAVTSAMMTKQQKQVRLIVWDYTLRAR
jgi:hypothetical protein